MRIAVSCFALLVAALCLVGVTGAAGSASFADIAGDSGAAPDVTSVTVANDDQGLITFRVTVGNRSKLGADDVVAVPFATDEPGKAGLRDDGMNFVVGLDGTSGAFLERWNGHDMVDVDPPPASLQASLVDGVVTVAVRQDDLAPGFPNLALPTRLAFYVLGITFDGPEVVAQDEAPDAADEVWSYRLVEPRRLVVTYFRAPKTARAGAAVVAHLGAAFSDNGRPVKPTKLTCRASVGGRALRGAPPGFTGYGVCSWSVPGSAKGKTIRGSVTFTGGGTSVSRSFSTRVR